MYVFTVASAATATVTCGGKCRKEQVPVATKTRANPGTRSPAQDCDLGTLLNL